MIDIKLYPAKSEKIRWIERKQGVIVLDPAKGIYHKLNQTATYIWQLCNGTRNIEDIYKLIAKEYNTNEDKIRRDISSAIYYLKRFGLIKLYKNSNRFYPNLKNRFKR